MRDEPQDDVVFAGFCVHLDVGVGSGGKETVDRGSHIVQMQRGLFLYRKDTVQLFRVERLLARNKDDAGDVFPFVRRRVTEDYRREDHEIAEHKSRVNSVPGANHHL